MPWYILVHFIVSKNGSAVKPAAGNSVWITIRLSWSIVFILSWSKHVYFFCLRVFALLKLPSAFSVLISVSIGSLEWLSVWKAVDSVMSPNSLVFDEPGLFLADRNWDNVGWFSSILPIFLFGVILYVIYVNLDNLYVFYANLDNLGFLTLNSRKFMFPFFKVTFLKL